MKFSRFILTLAFILAALPASAIDRVTALVTITNANGTTNGQTFTVNGSTRTWTNSVSVPSTQILTNNSANGAKTNLYNQIGLNPFTSVTLIDNATNSFKLIGGSGVLMTVTPSAGYATVTYSTQTVASAVAVVVPVSSMPSAPAQTNVASELVTAIENLSTNALNQNSVAASELVGLTNAQTGITGNKSFTGIIVVSNGAAIWYSGTVSNAAAISGVISYITNGLWRAGVLISPTLTNGANYGNAFRSPGSGAASEQFGTSATATGDNSIAIGNTATATNTYAFALGYHAVAGGSIGVSMALGQYSSAIGNGAMAVGSAATASSTTCMALGSGSIASNSYSTTIGVGAPSGLPYSREDYGFTLGIPANKVWIPGGLQVSGAISNSNFASTNYFPAGSDISFGRYANSSLANGNNAAVLVGTNVFVQVSGPSAAFNINGLDGSPNRDGKLVIILNYTGQNMTIAHDSGVDPVAANRIYTNTGADISTTGNGVCILIYSASASRWIVISFET